MVFANERLFWVDALHTRHPTTAAPYLAARARPPSRGQVTYDDGSVDRSTPAGSGPRAGGAAYELVLGATGAWMPLDATAVDPIGPAYPVAAHVRLSGRGRPGHEKALPTAWFLADYTSGDAPVPPGVDPNQVAAARRALDRGDLAELRHATRDRLTWGRFWRNLTGAVHRTRFRIPADPRAVLKAQEK